MNIDWVRDCCLSLPHATEQIQWVDDLVFKVGGKMFAVAVLVPARVWLSFKTTPEEFGQLTDLPGIIPAPYMARAQWVALEAPNALAPAELQRLLRQSYDLVFAKLPKKAQSALLKQPQRRKKPPSRKR